MLFLSKQILLKELVYCDFKKNEFRFFNVEVLSVGYNDMQVIVHFGKLGNKGRESITRLKDFKESMKIAYKKIYDKKSEGYISREKFEKAMEELMEKEKKSKQFRKRKKESSYHCDLCKKSIRKEIYQKIEEWARGEGNWDYDPSFIGYKKILCLDCQIEQDIFKKKMFSSKK